MKLKLTIKKHRLLEIIFLLVITLISFYLRFNKLMDGLPFTFDQAEFFTYVKDIVSGKLILIGPRTGIEGFFLGPLYFYLLVPFYLLFNGNPLGGAVMDAIFGVLAVPAIYFLTKKLFPGKTAIFAVIIGCFSPLLIGYSRYFWNPHPLIFFSILFYYAIANILEGKEIYIVLAFFSFACGLQLEIASAIYLLPTSIVIFVLCKYRPKVYIYWMIGLLVLLFSFIPQVVFNLRHQFLMMKSLIYYLTNGPKTSQTIPTIFLLRFEQLFDTYTKVIIGSQWKIFSLTLLFLSLYNLKKQLKKKSKGIILLFSWLIVNFTFLFFTREHLWEHHYISLYPAYIILTSLLINNLYNNKKLKIIAYFLLMVLISVYIYSYWPLRKVENKQLLFKDQLNAIDYLYKDSKGQPFNVEIYVPSVYITPYQYIFEWYGKRKYKYLPITNKNVKLLYFIIEPDYEIPARRSNWLYMKRNDGKLINDQSFGGGLVVEKRLRK